MSTRRVYKKGGAAAGRFVGKRVGAYYARSFVPRGTPFRSQVKRAAKGVGRTIGGQVGRQLGKLAHTARVGVRGSGAYYTVGGQATKQMIGEEPRGLILSRTEYVRDIYSGDFGNEASEFDVSHHQVNPGISTQQDGVFTWLSQIARGYQTYRFRKLIFHFRSTSGDATGSNTTLGQVIMACDYDSTRPLFVNKADMLNTMYAISGPPSANMDFIVECNPKDKRFNWWDVRNVALQEGQNINLKDFIRFAIATVGMQADNIQLGELHVTYEVEFTKYNYNNMGTLIPRALFYEDRKIQPSLWGITNADPLGGPGLLPYVADGDNTLKMRFEINPVTSRRVLRFPDGVIGGVYQIAIMWGGAVIALPMTAPVPNPTGAEFVPWLGTAFQQSTVANDSGAGGQVSIQYFMVKITKDEAWIDWQAGGSLPGEIQYLQISVTQIANDTTVPNLGPYIYS